MNVRVRVTCCLAAGLMLAASATSATAQDANLTGRVLADVCLPYASRGKSFERAIRSARDLQFRQPVGYQGPADEWATEIELVSRDGRWRIRLEEGTPDPDADRPAYSMRCSLSSSRTSVRQLANLGRQAFRNERYWIGDQGELRAWDRRTANPDEYRLQVRVLDEPGQIPTLSIEGLYY